jgi:hypothetical protein
VLVSLLVALPLVFAAVWAALVFAAVLAEPFLLGRLLTIFGCCGFRLGRFLLLDVNRAQALLLRVSPILQEPILQDSLCNSRST